MKELDEVSGLIVDTSLRIHRTIGPGLLESVYELLLARSLENAGLSVERQKAITFEFEGILFEEGFRADMVVEGKVVVEVKSVERLAPVHGKQLLTYLRLMNLPVGLLINFGSATLKEGLRRIVNKLPPTVSSLLRVNRSGQRAEFPPEAVQRRFRHGYLCRQPSGIGDMRLHVLENVALRGWGCSAQSRSDAETRSSRRKA